MEETENMYNSFDNVENIQKYIAQFGSQMLPEFLQSAFKKSSSIPFLYITLAAIVRASLWTKKKVNVC